jgi:hypothetical protein
VRKLWILSAAVVSLAQLSVASPACVADSLSAYIALGAGGCMVGGNTLSDFAILPGISGATPISPVDISLSPSGSTTNPGLVISVNVSANAGTVLEAFFTYALSGNSFSDSVIALSRSSETGDGAVTGTQDFCANGIFELNGVSGCTGTPGSLLTLDGVQNSDATSFAAAGFLNVTDDFTVDGGLAGSATAGTLSNQFSTVPESGTLLLAPIGIIFALGVIRRRLFQRIFS